MQYKGILKIYDIEMDVVVNLKRSNGGLLSWTGIANLKNKKDMKNIRNKANKYINRTIKTNIGTVWVELTDDVVNNRFFLILEGKGEFLGF